MTTSTVSSAPPLRVLAVDDNASLLRFLVSGLTACGCAVEAVASASRRNVTLIPMSGRIRGSSSLPLDSARGNPELVEGLKAMRTSTAAFCRSAVGTVVITLAGICQSG